jgi:hypothetical protein
MPTISLEHLDAEETIFIVNTLKNLVCNTEKKLEETVLGDLEKEYLIKTKKEAKNILFKIGA